MDMRLINSMALSKVLVLSILLMTACQATSPVNKSSTHTNDGFEHRSRHNYPVLDVTSDTVKRVKNTVIFERNAELNWDQSVRFLADYISIEFDESGTNYVVKMKGNVSMWKSTVLNIRSEKADSLDFSIYIDFIGKVNISNKGQQYKTDWVRYYFLQGELQFRWDDVPTRGHISGSTRT
jgi:hypothetical protein